MRLVVIAVGRDRAGPARDLFDDYVERIRRMGPGLGFQGFELAEIAESRLKAAPERKAEDAKAILAAAGPAPIVALDERGEDITSGDLARRLGRERDGGTQSLAFAIGGPDGLGEAVRERACLMIAFGRATWPHLMVRAMLAEQIYRSLTILGRHPYHRE